MCDATDPPLPCLHIGDSRRAEAGGPWRQGFPDLLVVGHTGHGVFAGMLLGSVSTHTVTHASCSVTVVRTA